MKKKIFCQSILRFISSVWKTFSLVSILSYQKDKISISVFVHLHTEMTESKARSNNCFTAITLKNTGQQFSEKQHDSSAVNSIKKSDMNEKVKSHWTCSELSENWTEATGEHWQEKLSTLRSNLVRTSRPSFHHL